jgi:hypothetical protein
MSVHVFRNEKIKQFNDSPTLFQHRQCVYENIQFFGCDFENCHLRRELEFERRTFVRNVGLVDCSWRRCSLGTAILQDVCVDTLKCNERSAIGMGWPLLHHVVIRGKVNKLSIAADPLVEAGPSADSTRMAYHRIRVDFYSSIDWALDISGAELAYARILGIPARLIRRDRESQAVITREKADIERWNKVWPSLDLVKQTDFITAIDRFVKSHDEDQVLVAGKLAKDFDLQLAAIKQLRNVGLVEPE